MKNSVNEDPHCKTSSNVSLTRRNFSGLLWSLSGTTIQAVIRIAVVIALARLLSPTEFGIVGAAVVVIGLSQTLGELGLGSAVVQRDTLNSNVIHTAYSASIAVGIITGVIVYFCAPALASLFRMPELTEVARALAIIFPVSSVCIVARALLQRAERFKEIAIVDTFSFLIGYGLTGITAALWGLGIWSLVFAEIGFSALKSIGTLALQRRSFGLNIDLREVRRLFDFGTGLSLARLGNYVGSQADHFVVGRWLGAEALGIYGRAYHFLLLPANLLGQVLDSILFPAMSKIQHDPTRLAKIYVRVLGVIALVCFPLSGLLILIAPELVQLLLGRQWTSATPILQIFASSLFFRTGYKISDSLVRAAGAVYQSAWRKWVFAAAVVIGAWIGHFWGLTGVAFGVTGAIGVNFFLMLQLAIKLVGATWQSVFWLQIRHFLIACAITTIAFFILQFLKQITTSDLLLTSGALIVFIAMLTSLYLFNRKLFGDECAWFVAMLVEKFSLVRK